MGFGQPLSLRPLVLEREFWCNRLSTMGEVPRRLLIVPRPELSRPGTEVVELKLRAHDGERLSALMGRSAFGADGQPLRLRLLGIGELLGVTWEAVDSGNTEVVYRPTSGRRLEDRVLDLIRVAQAVASIDGVDPESIEFVPPRQGATPDEIWIAEQLRGDCWD